MIDDSLVVPYHHAGDYCEGMYLQPVASNTLVTVSLTESVGKIDFEKDAPIRIDWSDTLPGMFHLQGTRIGAAPYDLDVKPGRLPWFEWSTSKVRKVGVRDDQLGFLVWSKRVSNGRERKLYFPANVSQGQVRGERHPRIVVVPGTQLEQVTVSLGTSDEDGRMTGWLIQARSAGSVLYPANAPIVLLLDELAAAPSGFYLIEVTAKASTGTLLSAEYHWLYHEL
jgi:hypothetical protein